MLTRVLRSSLRARSSTSLSASALRVARLPVGCVQQRAVATVMRDGLGMAVPKPEELTAEDEPEVSTKIISFNVINNSGERMPVKGRVGEKLLDVFYRYEISGAKAMARHHNDIATQPFFVPAECHGLSVPEEMYGQGPMCTSCYVWVPDQYIDKSPTKRSNAELRLYERLPDAHVSRNTRFACYFTLSEDMDGMTVALPEYRDSYNPELDVRVTVDVNAV